MELALYHPEWGYYAREPSQIGRSGDFFTSVSVGSLFGYLLALRAVAWWEDAGKPLCWRWLEVGAHNGTLAADVLDALFLLSPDAARGVRYTVVEPLPASRRAQRETLARFGDAVAIFSCAGEIPGPPLPSFFVANEVLDALPVHVVRRENGVWCERRVALDSSGTFVWTSAVIVPGPLADAVAQLPGGLPDGYQTEVRTGLREFLAPYLRVMERGRMLWIDYGFAADDYYIPGRGEGTLRTFRDHRAGDCPLSAPGEEDITAHVDFTAFAKDAMTLRAVPARFDSQGMWLIRAAEPWLRAMEGVADPVLARQFQMLTHPAHLGAKFHILELAWREAADPAAAQTALGRLGIS